MKARFSLVLVTAFWLACSVAGTAQQTESTVPDRLTVNINTQQAAEPVSKYEFGMFIEHIGSLVYRSLWSEKLDDRKFYFPITSKEEASSQRQGFPGMQLRKWRPVGPDEVVTMDKVHPFVGDQSPRIELDSATPHGIRQSGLALVKGKKYAGRIYLCGTPGSKVKVSLVWGEGAHDRQTISVPTLSEAYKKIPLSFTAGTDSVAASLEITGTGTGNFHIGTVSLMPTDNVQGFRPDTIALLRQLHSGFWRLPGGNFLSDWSWYDAVGDPDKRPPMFDYAWNAMQTNDVGMDEFMTLCKLIGVEPYITVNAGFGDAHSAAEEVEYLNGSVKTRLGAERARNGHPEPYHIKFWDIGNEPYGAWQLGRTDLKYYVLKHNEFAKAMLKVDPSITLLASGNMLEAMDLTGEMRAKDLDNLKSLEGTPQDWTGGLLEHSWGNFSGITQHWYAQGGRHFDLEKAKKLAPDAPTDDGYDKIDQTPLEYARYPANIVHLKAQEWARYQQRFPDMLKKKIFLSMDEYAYFGESFNRAPDLKLALAYGMIFNEMLRHTDFLTMSAHTMGVSSVDYSPTAATLNATGLMFKLYGSHFVPGSVPVALSGNSPQPAPKYPIGGDQPETNSGSPTYPLDMFAALTPDHKFLTVAVVNATKSEQKFELNVTGMQLAGKSELWELTGKDLEAANKVGQQPQLAVKEIPLGDATQAISVAPISVNVYQFPVTQAAQ
ncbi:MAG TPA: alpha-N-arabinofuranosidase [Terriglobales bacterium]|jgi:alpha-N-arabinofuranosidase